MFLMFGGHVDPTPPYTPPPAFVPTVPPVSGPSAPPAANSTLISTPEPRACAVTWLYAPPSWMTTLVAALAQGQDVVTGTTIDAYSMTPCEKATWLAGGGAGGNCEGTVCLGINDTPHGRYDRGLATLP